MEVMASWVGRKAANVPATALDALDRLIPEPPPSSFPLLLYSSLKAPPVEVTTVMLNFRWWPFGIV